MYRLGVDGGGTTTRVVIVDEQLQIIGRGEAGASNLHSVGLHRATENLLVAIEAAQKAAAIPPEQVVSWGLGLAGACSAAEQAQWRHQLVAHAGEAVLVIDEDAAAAQAGAFGGEAGAVCIAGTGANCFGINERGERARADGLGPLLGDRGSGYWIGEQALRAVCLAADGCGPGTALQAKVLAFLEIQTIDELVQLVYRDDWAKSRTAALFPLVVEAANESDRVALRILQQAGTELAQTTLSVLHSLAITRVAVTGGVLSRDTPVRSAYEVALRRENDAIEIGEPRFDAAIGGALLARSLV